MDRVLVQDSRRVRVQPWASREPGDVPLLKGAGMSASHPVRRFGSEFSIAGVDPLRKFGSEVSMKGVVESPELEGALLHLSYS
jgi:hypothetical protein